MDMNTKSRSWFCTLSNPSNYFRGTPEEIEKAALTAWCRFTPERRTDLEAIPEYIQQGLTPDEIMDIHFPYRRLEKDIRGAFYRKRFKETPPFRKKCVFIGTLEILALASVMSMCGCANGKERTMVILQAIPRTGLTSTMPCRYSNVYALWTEVHITSVLPPEEVYKNMAFEQAIVQGDDSSDQLKRRIHFIVYHWKNEKGEYCKLQSFAVFQARCQLHDIFSL